MRKHILPKNWSKCLLQSLKVPSVRCSYKLNSDTKPAVFPFVLERERPISKTIPSSRSVYVFMRNSSSAWKTKTKHQGRKVEKILEKCYSIFLQFKQNHSMVFQEGKGQGNLEEQPIIYSQFQGTLHTCFRGMIAECDYKT